MSLPKDSGASSLAGMSGLGGSGGGQPREGSREIHEGIIVSEPMDWCKSPSAIVPYKIWAKQIDAADLANSVRQTGDRSHVKASIVRACYGDEPGVGGGVVSGTHNAECTPKTWSATVRFEDRNAVRHDDEWWMNHKNTWGRLDYRKDISNYVTPASRTIDPRMQLAFYQAPGTATDAPPIGAPASEAPASSGLSGAFSRLGTTLGIASLGYGTGQMTGQYYLGQDGNVAVGITNYQTSQIPAFSPQGYAIGQSLGFPGSMSRVDEANNFLSLKAGAPVDFRTMPPDQLDKLVRQPWPSPDQIRKNAEALKNKKKPTPAPIPLNPNILRSTGNEDRRRCKCVTGAYSKIVKRCGAECGSTYQAHHIVPDYTLRYGNRDEGEAGRRRIPGLPSFQDGPAICLEGQARDAGSEHGLAHGADEEVRKLESQSAIQGTADIHSITNISQRYANLATNGQCAAEIAGALKAQPSLYTDALGRTTINAPDPSVDSDKPAYNALSQGLRATYH